MRRLSSCSRLAAGAATAAEPEAAPDSVAMRERVEDVPRKLAEAAMPRAAEAAKRELITAPEPPVPPLVPASAVALERSLEAAEARTPTAEPGAVQEPRWITLSARRRSRT